MRKGEKPRRPRKVSPARKGSRKGMTRPDAKAARLRERLRRLEAEVEDRTRDLTDALERQTATSEILGVISGSPTDVQPVFDTIVRSAVRLCDARFALVFRLEGDIVNLVAHHNYSPGALEQFQRSF